MRRQRRRSHPTTCTVVPAIGEVIDGAAGGVVSTMKSRAAGALSKPSSTVVRRIVCGPSARSIGGALSDQPPLSEMEDWPT
jgi:hypothetical protein